MAGQTVSARLTFSGVSEANKRTSDWVKQLEKALTILKQIEGARSFDRGVSSVKRYREELTRLKKELGEVSKQEGNRNRSRGSGSGSGQPTSRRDVRELSAILQDLDKQIIGTQTAINQLNRAVKEGVGRTDDEYQELITTLAKLKQESKEVTDDVRAQQREFAALETAEGSYRRINEQLGQMRKQYKELSRADRDGDIGRELLKNIKVLDVELKELDASMGLFQRNVGNYERAFNSLSAALTFAGVDLSLQGVRSGLESIIRLNSDASTAFTGVQKTVQGLNDGELAELEDILKNRINAGDTSTNLVDLLGIAEVGGRLGVAKEDISGFVGAIDTAVIALRDDLGGSAEDIATDLQRISGIFTEDRDDVEGTADGILRVGSAINQLAASGPTSAGFLVDFSKRLAGIAPAARVSVEEVLAFGSVLEEAGQSQEVAATSFSQILTVLGSDVDKFASIAGLTVEELRDKLQDSGTDALLAVLEGAGEVDGGLEQLNERLEQFGVSGQRTIGVLAALVNNTDNVREKIDLSNQAFSENVSLTQEAERVNADLSNRLENLSNVFQNAFTDLEVQRALAGIIDRLVDFLRVLQESGFTITGFAQTIKSNLPTIIALGAAVLGLGAQYVVLQARTLGAAVAQRLFNTVLRANPIGLVITAVSLLIAGYFALSNNIEEAQKKFAAFRARLDEIIASADSFSPVLGFILGQLRGLAFNIGLFLDVIESVPATLQGVQASFRTFFSTVGNSLARFTGGAVRLLGNFTKGLLFTGSGREVLKQNVSELREAAGDFANAGRDAGQAYADARNDYLKENPPVEATQESVRAAVEQATGTSPSPTGDDPTAPTPTPSGSGTSGSSAAEKELKARAEAIDRLEQTIGGKIKEAYRNLTSTELEAIQRQTQAALSEAEQKAREQQLQAELSYQEQLALLEGQFIAQTITEQEFNSSRESIEYNRQQSILSSEQEFAETRLELLREYLISTTTLEAEVSQSEVANERLVNTQKLKELEDFLSKQQKARQASRKEEEAAAKKARELELLNDKKKTEAKQSLERSALSFANSLNDAITQNAIDAATARIENEEERAAEIERIREESAKRQKALALFEIGVNLIREISALSVASAPDLTQITRTILTLAAIGRAAAASASVIARELEEGGEVGNIQSNQSGSNIPAQGPILGPSHSDGGIMAIDPAGNLINVEGQEYTLQNGQEQYVINKRSALQFRPLLDQLASVPASVYSPGKRLIASMINSYRGNGVRFENGGVLSAPSLPISGTNAILSSQASAQASGGSENEDMAPLLMNAILAINGRIDNLRVTASPRRLLSQGLEQKKLRRNGL